MSQTSVQSQHSAIPQASETPSKSFHTPDGPPQPHPREEIAQAQHSTRKEDTKSDNEPAIGPDEELSNERAQELGLPEQKHAGKVGYGPEIVNMHHVGIAEKAQGLKEEVLGKIKRDPGLANRGKERRTGELKRKEREEQNEADPFSPGEKQSANSSVDQKQNQDQNGAPPTSAPSQDNRDPTSVKFDDAGHPGQHRQTGGSANIDSDRRQVQEQQQVGRTRDVDLKPREGRLNPDAHEDKGVERAAQL